MEVYIEDMVVKILDMGKYYEDLEKTLTSISIFNMRLN